MGAIIGQEGRSSPDFGATALIPYCPSRFSTVLPYTFTAIPGFSTVLPMPATVIGGHPYRPSRVSGNPERYCLMMVLAATPTVLPA